MKNANIKAVVLRHKNFYEKDKLIVLYCEELGKTTVIAKGAQNITSKFTGHLETLNIINAQIYFGPKSTILTEAQALTDSKKLSQCLNKSMSALLISEITHNVLFENQKIEGLTELIQTTLENLKNTEKTFLISTGYIIKLFNIMGLMPDFKSVNSKLEKKYLKFFEFTKNNNYESINKICLSGNEQLQIKNLIKQTVEYHTEKNFNSIQYC